MFCDQLCLGTPLFVKFHLMVLQVLQLGGCHLYPVADICHLKVDGGYFTVLALQLNQPYGALLFCVTEPLIQRVKALEGRFKLSCGGGRVGVRGVTGMTDGADQAHQPEIS